MKKILAIILSFVYLSLSIGFPVSVHHCNSANETSLSIGHSTKCNCQVVEVKSCCSTEEVVETSSCSHLINTQPCCTFESLTIIWESDQQLPVGNQEKIQIKELIVYQNEAIIELEEEENNFQYFDLNPPPKRIIPLHILQSQFVFYG